ncbi:sperm-associated antigen 1-like [Diadema antillarum]|uniref:sperm-associated antigen 1-like n=1 Tax=Diadema antillarum TaxID=105358 RepID=UPI003A89DCA6
MADARATQQMLGVSTATESGVPLEHMDYNYIGKCTNVKELEKIFKALKSGKEGHYPDLVDFCEKRLADIAPSSKSLRKENRPATEYDVGKEEWTKVATDVKEWTNEIATKDEEIKSASSGKDGGDIPPVRNRGTINTSGKKNSSDKNDWGKPSSERIRGSDYRSWDKYDVDAEVEKMDKNVKEESLKKAAERLAKAQSTSLKDAINTEGMTDRERELAANREKDKGNEAFRAGDYPEAIRYYTRSLSVVQSAPAFNNRSLARIKLGEYEGATEDCTEVLDLEPSNIKALLRRGSARKSLKQYDLALKDLQAVLQVEPNNKQALDLVNDVVNKMDKEKTQIEAELKKKRDAAGTADEKSASREKPLQNGEMGGKNKGRRLVIEEVEGEESGDEEEETSKKDESTSKNARESGKKLEAGVDGEETKKENNDTNKSEGDGAPPSNNQEKDDSTEMDGCVGSKNQPEEPPKVESSQTSEESPKAGTDPSSGGAVSEEAAPEPTKPAPPKPAPPLPDAVVYLKDRGNEFFTKGQYGDACEQYGKAINKLEKDREVYPTALATLYANRASCHLRLGEAKLSVEDCNAALELNPNSIKTYVKRAKAYETLEKYSHAYVDYKTALNYDHYNVSAQEGSNRMAASLKDTHGAKWREKLPSQPKSPEIFWPTYTMAAPKATPAPAVDQATPTATATMTAATTTTSSSMATEPRPTPSPAPVSSPSPSSASPVDSAPPTASKGSSTHATAATSTANAAPGATSTTSTAAQATPSSDEAPSSPAAGGTTPEAESSQSTKDESPRGIAEKFQDLKAEGNSLVKKAMYKEAVECYSQCIEVDAAQAVSYTNRALCYLKLDQPEDAMADCSEALKRDPQSIKALYRRAQARKMLSNFQESIRDLMDLLKIDQNNLAAKKELEIVKDAWRKELREQQQQKEAEASSQKEGKDGGKKKKKSGKRVQIQEVNECSDEETESKTQTSSKANSSGKPAAEKGVANKAGGETSKQGQAKGSKDTASATTPSPSPDPSKPKKMTAYEFMHEWTSLKKKKNQDGYAALLKRVPPNDIPKVLSNKLDGDMLSKILSVLADLLVEEDPVHTFQLLMKLRSVDRFKTIAMFLTKRDKDNLQRCINKIPESDVCKEEDLKKLKKAYNL